MKSVLIKLIASALKKNASDIHFTVQQNILSINFRINNKVIKVKDKFDVKLVNYLKYLSGLDLAKSLKPQSGSFELSINHKIYSFRFSYLNNIEIETASLRILNNHKNLKLNDLSSSTSVTEKLIKIANLKSGLVLFSGPTGAGKTTSIYAILGEISQQRKVKIVSVEDPIEIKNPNFLQLQINEQNGFGYQEAVKTLLRHDFDILLIGEIRDAYTAKYCFQAALTGHLVFSTIHAKNNLEAIKRLNHFGLENSELYNCLEYLVNQRIIIKNKEKMAIFEIADSKNTSYMLENLKTPDNYKDINQIIDEIN